MDLQKELQNTKHLLQDIENNCNQIFSAYPRTEKPVHNEFNQLNKSINIAKTLIDKPKISFSVLGTTSAGKSTLVNALLGFELLPVNIGESSAGIVKINMSKDNSFTFKYGKITEDINKPSWIEEGKINSIGEFQKKIGEIMSDALKNRKINEQPYFEIYMPFLLTSERFKNMLQLPNYVEIELIDLPGIKGETDKTNIAVIRKMINETIPIVVIDYMTYFDDAKRNEMLNEVLELYKILDGNHKALIFLLNKVNLSVAGQSFEENKNNIATEIKNKLSINEGINVFPVNALLFSYIGSLLMNQDIPMNNANFDDLLKRLSEDIHSVNKHKKYDTDREVRQIIKDSIRKLEDIIEEYGSNLSEVEEIQSLIEIITRSCLELSYASDFLRVLKETIKKNINLLLFHPIITPVRRNLRHFAEDIQTALAILNEENQTKLESDLLKIKEIEVKCKTIIENYTNEFRKQEETIAKLQKEEWKGKSNLIIEQFQNDCQVIRQEINELIIKPTLNFLNSSLDEEISSKNLYYNCLLKALNEKTAKNLSHRANELKRWFYYSGENVTKSWVVTKEGREIPDKMQEYKNYKNIFNLFFTSLRESFKQRAERWLEISSSELERKNLEHSKIIANKIQDEVNNEILKLQISNLPNFDFINANLDTITVKDDLFELAQKDWGARFTTTEDKILKTGTCFDDKVKINVSNEQLTIPSTKELDYLWLNILREGVDNLTIHLSRAMTKSFTNYKDQLLSNINLKLQYLRTQIENRIIELKTQIESERIYIEEQINKNSLFFGKSETKMKNLINSD